MKYKKIFILTSHFPPQKGGVETSIRMFLDWAENKENYSVTVVTYDNRRESGEFKDYWNKNKVIRINVPKEHLKYMISLKEITLMNTLFRQLRYFLFNSFYLVVGAAKNRRQLRKSDCIIAKGAIIEIFATYIISLLFGKTYSIRFHTDLRSVLKTSFLKYVINICLRRSCKIIVNANDIKSEFEALGISPDKILVTNPSVNTSIFYPKNKMLTRDVLTLPQDKTIILFSSALNDTKFADFIIDIAYKLLDLNDKYFFIFVGEGYLDKDVEKLAIRYPLDVKFINKSIDQSDLSDYFNAADIAIGTVDIDYPSRIVLEAAACGCTVLIPDQSIHQKKRNIKTNWKIDLRNVFMVYPDKEQFLKFILDNRKNMLEIRDDIFLTGVAHEYIKRSYSSYAVHKNEVNFLFE